MKLFIVLLCLFALTCLLQGKSIRGVRNIKLQCGTFTCVTGEICCSDNLIGPSSVCFNPTVLTCPADQFQSGKNCLCGKDTGCCNGNCFNTNDAYCDTTTGQIKIKPPGVQCGSLNCQVGDQCCSNNVVGGTNRCYNSASATCLPDLFIPSQNCLCGVNDRCCKGVCFDAHEYQCSSTGQIEPISTPPSPSPSPSPSGQCGASLQCSGTDQCCANNVVGDPFSCYNPNALSCSADQFKPAQNCLCGKGDGCCNGICFKPSDATCNTTTGQLDFIPL